MRAGVPRLRGTPFATPQSRSPPCGDLSVSPAGGDLLLRGQSTVGREVIDGVRQVVREFRQQLLARHARLLFQLVDRVRPECVREFVRRKPPVLSRATQESAWSP